MAESGAESAPGQIPRGQVCDFCGKRVQRVRRVAVDRGYERLVPPHTERYACPECSEKKERERQGPS